MKALGHDPSRTDKISVPIDDFMTKLWSHWTNKVLESTTLEFLLSQYELPKFLTVPIINPEILEFLEPNAITRDEFLKQSHEVSANAIISSGALAVVFMDSEFPIDEETRVHVISMISESLKLQCHLFYEQAQSRRSFIIRAIKDLSFKVLLEKQEVDEFLFGSDLAAKVKTYKNVKNVAKEIAPPKSKAKQFCRKGQLTLFGTTSPGRVTQQNLWTVKNNQLMSKRNYKSQAF